METPDKQKLWRPSWKFVVISILLGVNIILIRIIGARDKEKNRNELRLRNISQELCVSVTDRSSGCLLCPYGWFLHGGRCYYYSDVSDKTWNQSRDHCKMMGADLVAIKDKEQEEIIQRSIRQRGEDTYWIGLHYDGDDWRWADGEPYNSSLIQIRTRPPGLCMSLATSVYHQTNCNSTNRWICQKKAVRIRLSQS
ncbi:killer cell lectin-like receptor subfamily B member 1B allele B [Leptodactylus fuscus]|uniref:killer cell lectin-like receptor subfamily B member 1B allele B n=1 Tax=Leptodactylus fuscus TaxID=238119 RepID=UPI003F4F109C